MALGHRHGVDVGALDLRYAAGRPPVYPGVEVPRAAQASRRGRQVRETPPAPSWPLSYCAARYSLAGDPACFWPLWWGLTTEASRLGRRERWQPMVRGLDGKRRHYLHDLSALVLDELVHRPIFTAAPALLAACCGVSPETWRRHLVQRFRALQAIFARWVAEGLETLRGWILE